MSKIVFISVVIITQTFLILALLFNLRRRRSAELSLQASEKKYHDIFDNAIMGIYQSTPAGTYQSVNPALAKLFGYGTPEEMISSVGNIQKEVYVHPEDRVRLKKIFTEEGEVKGFQVEYKRRDDSRFWISITGKAIRDEKGNILYYEGTVEDITQQKQAETELIKYREQLEALVKERTEKLEQINKMLSQEIEERTRTEKALIKSETMYRDLVESANSIILRWRPDGSVTFFNTYAQKFFGFTESEIIGRNILGTIVPVMESSGRSLPEMIDGIVHNPDAHVFNENENIRKNGEKVWIAWANKPVFDETGFVMEILSVGNDITARKSIEESLKNTLKELTKAKERAEAADQIKSAFLATMSHELRTPLNSIIGFTGVILQGLAGPLTDEQKKQMGMVRNSAQHLLSLINDVLDISKIEAGQFEVYSEPFSLRTVIEKTATILKPAADKKGITLNIDIENEIGEVWSDRRRVEQVLLNLLNNAIKFTDRGNVTLSAELIPGYKLPYADRRVNPVPAVQFRISDTGIGIHPDDLRELFQPFRQIDTGLARRNEGTGLGLAICRRLAELMGGEVTAESDFGHGSVFTFIIPLDKREIL